MADFDVIVIGGGVNGLACAATLTREGLSCCVLERNGYVGGGAVTREVTLPGFRHDLYGSSHVWIHCNSDFKAIQPELERFGLKYIEPQDHITGHPDRSAGPGIVVYKSVERTCESIAAYSAADARRYEAVCADFEQIREGFIKAFFSPPSPPSTLPRALEQSVDGLRRLQEFSMSARAWVEANFEDDFVQAMMLNWALAPQILPDQEGAGQSFYIMIPAIHYYGPGDSRGREPAASEGDGGISGGQRQPGNDFLAGRTDSGGAGPGLRRAPGIGRDPARAPGGGVGPGAAPDFSAHAG